MKTFLQRNITELRQIQFDARRLRICCNLLILTAVAIAPAKVEAQADPPDSLHHVILPQEYMREINIRNEIVHTYAQVSKSAFLEGSFAIAERAARNGLAVVPGNIRLLRLQGESLIRLGLEVEALRVFKEVNGSQSDTASFARIGLLMARQGQVNESLNMANGGLLDELLPESFRGTVPIPRSTRDLKAYWLITIGIEAELGANDEHSMFYYSGLLQLQPNHVFVNLRLGKIYMRNERFVEAADCYRRITSGPGKTVRDAKRQLKIALSRAEKATNSGGGG